MNRVSVYRFALAASAAMIVGVSAAHADENAPQEESASKQIVVTGQRQAYHGDVPLRELPQSVQVIDSKLLTNAGITRLDTALDMASGVSRQNNFGGLWDSFAIRGFAGDENFPSGFLVNGFNGGRGYGGPRDASNIDHIEILKGPNSALFGRGEPGGTVNIVTKKPDFAGEKGSFTVSGGSFNTWRVEGDFNMPVTDTIAFRVNGASERGDSFRDTVKTQKYTISPSVLAKITPTTTFTYELEYVNQAVPFERGVVAIDGKLGAIPNSRFLGEPGDGPTRVEVLGHQAQLQQDLGKDWSLLVGFGYRDTSFAGFSSDPELAASRQPFFTDHTNLARQRRYRDYSTQNLVARGEISGKLYTFGLTHHVILGADYDKFDIDTLQKRYRPPAYKPGSPITAKNNAINIFNPVYGSLPVPTSTLTNQLEHQKAWGIYFQDQIDLTDKLKVRFGGRYDDFDQNILFRTSATTFAAKHTKFSPQAGLVYEVTKQFSLYGGYGRGFRPNSGTDAFSHAFAPETTKSYEVGAKYVSPGGAITSTLALYSMKKDNVLTSDPVNAGFSMAVGRARSKGVEFDLTAKLPQDFQLYLNYAYTDAAWDQDALDPNFNQPIHKGDPLINIPKHNANALLFKDIDTRIGKVTLGGGVNYISKRLGETATNFFLPDYTLVKLLAAYEPTEHFRLSADINNLFDKRYYPSSYSQLWVQPGAPRTFTVRASFRF